MQAGEPADDDARAETARLSRALAAHVRRRGAAGQRRAPIARSERDVASTREPASASDRTTPDASARDIATPRSDTTGRASSGSRAPVHAEQAAQSAKRAPERARTNARDDVSPMVASGSRVASGWSTPVARSADDVRRLARGARDLDELRALVAGCEACGLCRTRKQTVFMDGEGARRVLFVGEAPGADEDRTGVPFVGRAGQLLTDIITKGMGIDRNEVFIANVLKCRPPDNRDPTTEEKATCTPWLDRQIELMDPTVIIPLGRHAAMHVLGGVASMGAMRGKVHERGGRKIVPTFHPAYLLRSPGEKKECWKDIQLAMDVLGLRRTMRGAGGPEASA
jgi:DNA polymerase